MYLLGKRLKTLVAKRPKNAVAYMRWRFTPLSVVFEPVEAAREALLKSSRVLSPKVSLPPWVELSHGLIQVPVHRRRERISRASCSLLRKRSNPFCSYVLVRTWSCGHI